MDDVKIIELFWQRDAQALEEIQRQYGGLCRSIAANVLQDPRDAEETVNDAMAAAWSAIPPERPEHLSSYLAGITRNLALKRLREQTAQKRGGGAVPEPLEELEDCVPDGTRVEDSLEAQELADAIQTFLGSLSDLDRRIFLRRYWFFDDIQSIAARFGCSKSKVKMTLKRRRDELAVYLQRKGYII